MCQVLIDRPRAIFSGDIDVVGILPPDRLKICQPSLESRIVFHFKQFEARKSVIHLKGGSQRTEFELR
jgi:predicted Rossmann-fold nucleotide-binding protein